MLTLQGYGTSIGVADGPLCRYVSPQQIPQPRTISDVKAERVRFDAAVSTVLDGLKQRREDANAREFSVSDGAMLELQISMLEDADFLAAAQGAIKQHKLCAEYAVYSTGKAYAAKLSALDDAYLAARGNDALSATQAVVQLLAGETLSALLSGITGRVVLAADTLLPSQLVQLDHSKITGILLREGTETSLTTIWARNLAIPTVTGLGDGMNSLLQDARTMVDGESGLVVQNPDTPTMTQFVQKRLQGVRDERQMQMLRGLPAQTTDGVTIMLTANAALPDDARRAVSCDAEGIGLFRSELLYLKDGVFPSEDTLYRQYRETLLMMGGKRVVIRLIDSSSDRAFFCPDALPETNPAFGVRPIPYAAINPALLEPQLRALLRASAYGNLAILLPLVVCAQEVRDVKERISALRDELGTEHKSMCKQIPVGALIETPAAAATADLIAQEADFLSIGTNDLAQYLFAADRTCTRDTDTLNSHHPAMLRTVAQVVRIAHAMSVPVSICGESAADISLAAFYAGLHVTELSMAPANILKMKRAIRALTAENCRAALRSCLQAAPVTPKATADANQKNRES